MNNRIMPKWSEVKDCNGINLHLFDAVQVITSGNKRNNQTGRIIALLKTKPYLQMVEVLFKDGSVQISSRHLFVSLKAQRTRRERHWQKSTP